MKYDQKALYAELTHFYLSICEKEQLDEPRNKRARGEFSA